MANHLVRWDTKWREKGLTVIDVNNGGIDTFGALSAYVKKNGKPYATLWDAEGRVCASYGVEAYPYAVLIGTDGNVVWEMDQGPGDFAAIERRIEAELAKVK